MPDDALTPHIKITFEVANHIKVTSLGLHLRRLFSSIQYLVLSPQGTLLTSLEVGAESFSLVLAPLLY